MKEFNNRILFLRPVLNAYGASKMLSQLACELKNLGYTIIVASDNNDRFKSQFQRMGIKHYTVPFRPDRKNIFNFLVCLIRLSVIVRKEKITIIHSHHRWSSFVSFFVSRMFRIPLVTTYHGINSEKRLLTLWGDTVISVSEDAKKHLIDYFKVTPNHIKVIHNGIKLPDTDWDDIKHNKNPKSNHNGGTTIANIARMSPEKDQESLFMAMKIVLHDHPHARLLMVGTGPLENKLKRLAIELDMEGNIEFVGEVEKISDILAKIDIVVLTSLTEGLPISILEALSFGIPVVATSVGDIPEIISDRTTGCLVPPKDPEGLANAINFMLSNYDAAMEMGQNGKKLVREKFSAKQMANETEKVYLSLFPRSN